MNQSFGQSSQAFANNRDSLQSKANHNMNSHSVEKTNVRSRNKSKFTATASHGNQSALLGGGPSASNKFDSSMNNQAILDMHFKTTTSVAGTNSNNTTKKNYSSKNNPLNQGNPLSASGNNGNVNSSIGNNYASNVTFLKQQLMASKKASNLLMKGLSPLKKL